MRTDICMMFVAMLGANAQLLFPDELHAALSKTINKNCGEMPYSVHRRTKFGRIYENPWLVLLRHPQDGLHFCHGTLITNQFVLTTAVCSGPILTNGMATTEDRPTEIVLGEYDLNHKSDCAVDKNCSLAATTLSVDKVIIHPNFSSSSYENDIALLVLNDSIQLSNNVRPICLPLFPLVKDSDDHVLNIYNVLWSANNRPSQVWMRYVPFANCKEQLRNWTTVTTGQMCARIHNNSRINMLGGAGSALQVDFHERVYQIGILSIGFSNTASNNPYVYVDISKYTTWIDNIT
ncbi:chymotrypsin-like protease CTRL-1 [Anopheles cruzii]|uniref:chymotrypsin-like protease CTRL-1 n=1 Tax=Anopheles cruzii TaxID=68878 RepID=UPI0022EC387B|nr:chymotrypsin-like protease CTRL-1 [Anopheles cruzii]